MEKIDGKTGLLNPSNLAKQSSGFQKFHQFGVLSKRINYHKTIENENMVDFFFFKNFLAKCNFFFKNFLKRLHSAKTLYGTQKFNKEFLQSEVYRKNTSKYNKSKRIFLKEKTVFGIL